MPMTLSAIGASIASAASSTAAAVSAAGAYVSGTVAAGLTSVGVGSATAAAIGDAVVNLAVSTMLSSAASLLQSRPSPGVQWRTAQGPHETRRIPCGKVYTTGRSMGDAITWGQSNKHAVQLFALADVQIGGIASFKVAGNNDNFFGLLVNGYPAAFRNIDTDSRGYEISETVNPFTKQRVDDFLVGRDWKFHVRFHFGLDNQGADPWMVSEIPSDKWDNTAVGKNLAYLRAYSYYDSDIFTGLPTFACYLNGALMYNPAKDSTVGGSGSHRWGNSATYEVSTNPAVIAYNIARGFFNSDGEMVYGSGYAPEDLPLDFWIPAIQACDELITDKDGTQSPRYSCSFEIDITEEPRKYLKICETAMAGRITEDRGQLLAYAGVAQTPIFSFTDADKVSEAPNQYDAKLGLDNLKNTVTGRFLSVAECFVLVDAPPRESVDDIAEDGGIPLIDNIDLSMITHGPTTQRVMEATRQRHRAQATCIRTFRLPALNARKGQWISGTSADWIGTKWFEIVKAVPNLETLCVTMSLREVPYNFANWSAQRDELDRYIVTLPSADPIDPLVATGIDADPLGEQGGDGSTAPGIAVSYQVIDDPSARRVELQVAKIIGSGEYGESTSSTRFSDMSAAFTTEMLDHVVVIDGVDTNGAQFTGIVKGRDGPAVIILDRSTSVNAANRPWMVLGDTQCFYDPDVSSGVIKASNLLGETRYAYRVRIAGLEGRSAIWSDWHTITTPKASLPTNSVGIEQLTNAVTSGIDGAVQKADQVARDEAKSVRDLADKIVAALAASTLSALGGALDVQMVRNAISSATGAATADFASQLLAATGPDSALVRLTETLKAQLTGLPSTTGSVSAAINQAATAYVTVTDALAQTLDEMDVAYKTADETLSGRISDETLARTDAEGVIVERVGHIEANYITTTSLSQALNSYVTIESASETYATIDAVNSFAATFGNNQSTAVFKVGTTATSQGAAASGSFTFTVSDGTHTLSAGWKVDLVVTNGVAKSVLKASAGEIEFEASQVKFKGSNGTKVSILDPETGLITTNGLLANAASQFSEVAVSPQAAVSHNLTNPTDTTGIDSDTKVPMSNRIFPAANRTSMLVFFVGSFVATTGDTTHATAGFDVGTPNQGGTGYDVDEQTLWKRRFSIVDEVASFVVMTVVGKNGYAVPWAASNGQHINIFGKKIITFSQT